ncbi:MAG: hypothetical protein PHW18_06850 [Sulfuricurvum sp.]|uniref:hypothetical protein n=1 Tax=Sulfuricurvum sp. TaxID=2025608 RepID=UPI0026167486|nr:hypothetical protein [Sulfuricurvum sp.]MDD2829277.1 hypothetical protein [Sulfuricurvum sp.]MDD4949959.1 hypothetical protein [Sulfuricurvum sp.]
MRWCSFLVMVSATALMGGDYVPCDKSYPAWAYNQSKCDNKTLNYTHDAGLPELFGGEASMSYGLKKNETTETLSMGAQYSLEEFSAKLQGSYIKNRFDNTPPIGNTKLSLLYRKKLGDSLALNAMENITIPVKTTSAQSDPTQYTSILKALYPMNTFYNVFAEGSYSLLDSPSTDNSIYRNPYSYTTGINYTNGGDTAINASYILMRDSDPTVGENKKIKLVHKHKINKAVKTSVSITKSLEAENQDNKAYFDVNYAF